MASGRLVNGNWMPAVDSDGYPIPDAYIRVYTNRTTMLAPIFADQSLSTPLENPVYADSSGQFPPIWQDNSLLFSLEFSSVQLGQLGTVDDLAPSSSIGGDLVTKANVNLDNATIPLIASYQPTAAAYHRKRTLLPSDMLSYVDDPEAPNDLAFSEMLSDATDQYASGECAIVEPFLLSGTMVGPQRVGIAVPENVKLVSGDNMDISLNVTKPYSGARSLVTFADNVTQMFTLASGAKMTGISGAKLTASALPSNIANVFTRLGAFSGDGVTANSVPGVEIRDVTIVGCARWGVVLGCERHVIEGVKGDNLGGVEILDTFDLSTLDRASFWPYFAMGWLRNWLGAPGSPNYAARRRLYDMALVRPGTAVKVAPVGGIGTGTGADGEIVSRIQSFGYGRGVQAVDANACFFRDLWVDHVFSMQATQAQADAYAALTTPQQATVRADTLAAALLDAGGGTSGFNYAQYNAHPLYGTVQSLGITTEGDCQNTQISDSHSDSQAKNFVFLHGGGQMGIVARGLTSGSARLAQLEVGDNRGQIAGFNYAGGANDAAILVGPGVQDWTVSGFNGDESTAAQPIRFGNPTTAKNFKIVGPWVHNSVIQSTLVRAIPTGNPAPATGSFLPVVWGTEQEDRLGEYNNASGIYTTKYPGTLSTKAWIVFTPTVATGGQHALRLKQNGGAIKTVFCRSESTSQYSLELELDVNCAPGDTLSYEVFHEVGATWQGGECGVQLRTTGQF